MKTIIAALCLLVGALTGQSLAQDAQAPNSGPAQAAADPWPRTADLDGAKYTIYQPQLDSWDNVTMAAHAAVSVQPPGSQSPVFGMLKLTASTTIDKLARTVYVTDIRVAGANFPSAPNWAASYQQAFQSLLEKSLTMSLDRLEAALAVVQAQSQAGSVEVQNPVPQFEFSQRPAVLVTIDGDPVWRRIEGTPYERVFNTRPLLLRDGANYYFHLFDGFLKAPGLAGPWTFDPATPAAIARATTNLAADGEIDLMTGPRDEKTGKVPTLTAAAAPDVIVVTRPTELIVTNGAPDWAPLEGTSSLLYIKNTDANVFIDINTQQNYVLVSGRWFTSAGQNHPWTYIAAKDLPAAFRDISDQSAKENVKASIPGTKQAREAIISSQIPQMAHVDRAKATFSPQIAGTPEIRAIERTTLKYVVNAPVPTIQASNGAWFAVEKGVWFTAPTLQGPWAVAVSVPAEIYAIPPSSPLYYATYVRIYGATPTTVTVGYLPGYVGAYVSDGTLVYGTGYAYAPYIGSTVWYAAPVTYGYAANPAWTPWTGWGVGFGMGWGYGAAWGAAAWGWGAAPYWGAYSGAVWGANGAYGAWGPGGWAASSGNVYHQWGNTEAVSRSSAGYNAWTGNAWSGEAARSYNSQTGRISAGQRGTVENVYSGNYASGTRGATYNPNTGVSASGARGEVGNAYTGQSTNVARANVSGPGGNDVRAATVGNDHYADVNGNVYKNTGSGWQQHDSGGGWSNASSDNERAMNSEQDARDMGERRSSASSYGGGDRGFGGGGGGFDRGGFGGGGGFDRGGFGGGGFRGGRR